MLFFVNFVIHPDELDHLHFFIFKYNLQMISVNSL